MSRSLVERINSQFLGIRIDLALDLRRHLLFKTNHPSEDEAFKVKERGTHSSAEKGVARRVNSVTAMYAF